jgi:hypothetical protein
MSDYFQTPFETEECKSHWATFYALRFTRRHALGAWQRRVMRCTTATTYQQEKAVARFPGLAVAANVYCEKRHATPVTITSDSKGTSMFVDGH